MCYRWQFDHFTKKVVFKGCFHILLLYIVKYHIIGLFYKDKQIDRQIDR